MQQWQSDDICPLIELAEGFSPLSIWQEIHINAELWTKGVGDVSDRQELLNTALRMVKRLVDFPAQRWIGFNHAIGWTREAATALSWCPNASLNDIITIWNSLEFVASPQSDSAFSALLLNPAILPPNILSELIDKGGKNKFGVGLLIAARNELPLIDISPELQSRLPTEVVQMLTARGWKD